MFFILIFYLPFLSFFGSHFFIVNEFVTTLTLLNAIAAPAITGLNRNPVIGYNKPAAIGIPRVL